MVGSYNNSKDNLQQKVNQLVELQKLTTSIQRNLDLKEVLQQVATGVVDILGYSHCFILARDEKTEVIRGTAFYSKKGAALERKVEKAIGRSMTEIEHPPVKGYSRGVDYAMSGQVMITDHLYEICDPPLSREECDAVQKITEAKTIVSMPLLTADRYLGSAIAFTEQEYGTEVELEPLKLLADQATVIADNIRLYDEMLFTFQKLRESEEITRGMLESAAAGVYLVRDGKFQYVSPLFEQITGYSSDELLGTVAIDYIHPEDRELTIEKVVENLKGKSNLPHEFRIVRKDSNPVWVLEKVASIGYKGKRSTLGSVMDISELKRAEESLLASEEKLRFMFESMGEGVVVTDLDGRILEANRAALQMGGFASREEIIGRSGFDFVVEKDRAGVAEQNMRNIFEGQGSTVEYTAVNRYGKEFEAEAIGAMLRDASGRPVGFIVAIRDITERKRIERMKTDFVSLVSHQLKTPVAGIKAYIENMMSGLAGDLTDKQKLYLIEMRELCQRNYRLISDLLNISMIERGVLSVNTQPVRLGDIVNSVVVDYLQDIEKKGLILNIEERGSEVVVAADRDKLAEALRNIVDNAVKFTDKGSITIRTGEVGGCGTIAVEDTGVGMSEETLKALFSRDKVLSGGPKAGAGAALGLYIAKGFMTLQQGDISVTSAPGRGSTFTLKIPKR